MKGIYAYWDNKLSQYVYIGKDSYIDKKARYKSHMYPSRYDEQQINRVLQNNPERYEYSVFVKGNFTPNLLCWLEKKYIAKYNPRFNFTKGGDGRINFETPEETKKKMALSNSKTKTTTGYFRVYKQKNKKCKQGFTWKYQYFENGKRKTINSISLEKLEEKVKTKGLLWKKVKDDTNDR